MSLILAPGLHKTFLLLYLPFLSQPLQVSCRGLTIELPRRNACSTLRVSECWSWSAESLLVSSILNPCDCAALLARFAGGLGYVVGYCEVLGAVVVVVAVCHLWQTCCCYWCWRNCYGQVFQAVWAHPASLKVLVLLLALRSGWLWGYHSLL